MIRLKVRPIVRRMFPIGVTDMAQRCVRAGITRDTTTIRASVYTLATSRNVVARGFQQIALQQTRNYDALMVQTGFLFPPV